MEHRMIWFACVLLLLPILACQQETPLAPGVEQQDLAQPYVDPEQIAIAIMTATGWPSVDEDGNPVTFESLPGSPVDKCDLIDFSREIIVGDIAHYSFQIQVGPEPFGVIGLHRIVREQRPNRPIRARESLFMQHGDGVNFVDAFLPGVGLGYIPVDFGLPVFLARNDVDVWGIDMAWTFIPNETTDFGFAMDWGLQREIDDLRAGIGIARYVRLMTGNGWRKMDLLGWSTGAQEGFVYLNAESQLPPGHRHVKGFIPVDATLKSDDDGILVGTCASYQAIQDARDNGIYVDETGALAQFAAYLATIDPDGDSPIFPGFTNLQVVLAAVTMTTQVLGGDIPHFHLMAGVFDAMGMPTGLQFADTQFAVDFYATWVPYQPNLIGQQINGITCPDVDLPFDDHLMDVTVPILWVGAGGGAGTLGEYMSSVVGSDDFEALIPSTSPDPYLDFGHVDLFAAYQGVDVAQLVWQPILDWMRDHRSEAEDLPLGVALAE